MMLCASQHPPHNAPSRQTSSDTLYQQIHQSCSHLLALQVEEYFFSVTVSDATS